MIIMFQYINYLYLDLFTFKNYENATTNEEKLAIAADSLEKYGRINFVGTILSLSYLINLLCRIIFNYFSKVKIHSDIWLITDIVAAAVNIAAFNWIGL